MTQEITLSELKSSQFEIREEPRDTPLPTASPHRVYRIFGFARTTQILNSSHSVLNDYVLISRNMTGASEVLQETGPESSAHESITSEPPHMALTEAEIANRDRLELLARAYVAGNLSPEENARLAIVADRVRRLIPRVTVADFEQLERMAEDVRRFDEEDNNRRRRLGLF